MKLCILGGTGFIGRHVCECLSRRGLSADIISRRPDLDFLAGLAGSLSGLTLGSMEAHAALETCDVLLHLASSSLPGINWNEPTAELIRCGLHENQFLEDLLKTNPRAHIVYASSGGQIYGRKHRSPIPESAVPAPMTAYALGKFVTEATLNLLGQACGNKVTILRIANPVGRWQLGRKHGFVGAAVTAARKGTPLTIFGDGHNVRDYFDADDLAEFLVDISFGPSTPPGLFNVGSDAGATELHVVGIVSEVVGRPINVLFERARPFDLPYALLDSRLARREIGWRPQTDLRRSVRKLLDAFA